MAGKADTVTSFLESLKSGDVKADLLTEGARFQALNVDIPGRDGVIERLTADTTGRPFKAMTWQTPTPDGEALQVRGALPAGQRLAGLILTVHFEGDKISVIQQQGLPGTPMDATAIKMPDDLKQRINNALKERHPMLIAYTDESGQPVVTFRGSTQAFSDDQLAIWVRNPDGSFLGSIKKNPKVALMYRDEDSKATYTFQGRAHVAGDEASRRQVYTTMAQVERDHDFARNGVALLIDLDNVQGYAGLGPSGQIDPIRMIRS